MAGGITPAVVINVASGTTVIGTIVVIGIARSVVVSLRLRRRCTGARRLARNSPARRRRGT